MHNFRPEVCGRAPGSSHHRHPQEGGRRPRLQPGGRQGLAIWRQAHDYQENFYR